MSTIRASIGILTYQSAATLERCLESVKEFSDIVIADGGSTDATLEIAKRYGARILSQSNPGHPITDFARERSILLSAATEDWFFYLDSDEVVSTELKTDIQKIVENEHLQQGAFRVRYLKTNHNLSRIYRTFKEYYQVRLFRTNVGARFERAVHERIVLPKEVQVGQIEGPWYVILDADDLSFAVFSKKAWQRTGVTASSWKPRGILDALHRVILSPFGQMMKSLIKIVAVQIRWGKNAIPVKYELLRVLYAWFLFVRHVQRLATYIGGVFR